MPVVSIRHLTTYRYRTPVAFGEHRVMYRPLESFDQRVLSAELTVGPEPSLLSHVHEVSGAGVAVVRFDSRADRLTFESQVIVDHLPRPAFDLEGELSKIGAARFAYDPDEAADLALFVSRRHPDDGKVEAWARSFVRPSGGTRLSRVLSDMTQAIRETFAYALRLDGPPQTPVETLARRAGACCDFAVLLVEAARSLGLAARFTSGYVYSDATSVERTGGGHAHAWARVYLPDCGWVDFDPTNGLVGNQDLVRVAEVIDPRAALPLYGSWSGLKSDFLGMDVEVDVAMVPTMQPAAHLRVAHGH
jgi:transglutaminase-like putative cysteine protease